MYIETSSKVFWETYQGKRYLLFDFSNLDSKDIFTLAVNSAYEIKKEKKHSVLSLVDVTDAEISFNTILTIKKLAKSSQVFVEKSAIVSNLKETNLLFQLYKKYTNSKAILFESREKALEYLFETE